MNLELCKKKTKCSSCKIDMRAGDIRSVEGGTSYNDPQLYKCLACVKKTMFPFDDLVRAYKQKIKYYESQIKILEEVKKKI